MLCIYGRTLSTGYVVVVYGSCLRPLLKLDPVQGFPSRVGYSLSVLELNA